MSSARINPALIVALIALVMAMTGAAVALKGKNRVGADDIKRNAVRSQEVKGKSLRGSDLDDDAIRSQQVAPESLDASDLAEYGVADDAPTRVLATAAPSADAARLAAPQTVLFEEGDLTVYAKCFRATLGGETSGEIYVRTSADGALLTGADTLPDDGAAMLSPDTPEPDRVLASESVVVADGADFASADGALAAADGTSFATVSTIGVKQGDVAGAEGVFGEGDACIFALTTLG